MRGETKDVKRERGKVKRERQEVKSNTERLETGFESKEMRKNTHPFRSPPRRLCEYW